VVDAGRHISKRGSELQGCDSHCGSELGIGDFERVSDASGILYKAIAFFVLLDSAIPAKVAAAEAADRVPNDRLSIGRMGWRIPDRRERLIFPPISAFLFGAV
jgi:hypothetical protein